MKSIDISTKAHSEMIDITHLIKRIVPPAMNGICHIFCTHTTAGLTINENADPDVCHDINVALDKLIPWKQPFFQHYEGNSAAHLKSSMMGFAQTVPVQDGELVLGRWQGIYFCEFDGPRSRSVIIQFIKES